MKWRDLTDWLWPTLAPLPEKYHKNLEEKCEFEIREKTRLLANNPEGAKIWAEEELRELENEQERNHRQSQQIEFYRNVSVVSVLVPIISLLAIIKPLFLEGSLRPVTLLERVYLVVLLFSIIYIFMNTTIVFKSVYRALNPKAYPSNPLLVDMTGVKDNLRIAAARSRAQLSWTMITDRIISERKLAIRAAKNIAIGVSIFLTCIVLSVSAIRDPIPHENHTGIREPVGLTTIRSDSSANIFLDIYTSISSITGICVPVVITICRESSPIRNDTLTLNNNQ